MNDEVIIYTDGACSGNPGAGGYACILICGKKEKEISGGEALTTNNRMELTAVIKGLEALKRSCDVKIYSDSKYVVDAINKGWAEKWRKNNYIKPDKTPAKNPELFEKLLELCRYHHVRFIWVKGHADNPGNERCDALARAEIGRLRG